jgi:hypothetical protein
MKIRNGFVSNSSSSSFIVAVKNGTLKEKLSSLEKEMKLKLKGYPFISIIGDIFSTIEHNAEKFDFADKIQDFGSEDEFYENYPYVKELVKKGYTLYEVEVSSDDYEDMSLYLYNSMDKIEYKSKDLIITESY